jgi:hypothetical protein
MTLPTLMSRLFSRTTTLWAVSNRALDEDHVDEQCSQPDLLRSRCQRSTEPDDLEVYQLWYWKLHYCQCCCELPRCRKELGFGKSRDEGS